MQEKNGNGRTFRFRGLSLSDREQTPKYSVVKREKIPQKRLNSPAEFAPGRLPVKPGKRNNEISKREFPQKKRDSPGRTCFPVDCRTKRESGTTRFSKGNIPPKKRYTPGEACSPVCCRTNRESGGESVPILRVEGTTEPYSIRGFVPKTRAKTHPSEPTYVRQRLTRSSEPTYVHPRPTRSPEPTYVRPRPTRPSEPTYVRPRLTRPPAHSRKRSNEIFKREFPQKKRDSPGRT